MEELTTKVAQRLLPDPCDIDRWYPVEWNGRKLDLKLTWSKRYNRSFVWCRFVVDRYCDGMRSNLI